MQRSTDRILTTHTGSLPRSSSLVALLQRRLAGQEVDDSAFQVALQEDEKRIVQKQAEAKIDVAGDGEVARTGFASYVSDRMSGFGGIAKRKTSTQFTKFPGYAALKTGNPSESEFTRAKVGFDLPAAQKAVRYDPGLTAAKTELDAFDTALKRSGAHFADTFVTAASPGIVSTILLRDEHNPAYPTDTEYVLDLADQLKTEYSYIVSRGHILQLDAPDLAMERFVMFGDRPMSEFLDRVELHIEAINRAVAGLPRDRVRLHVCWGNLDLPHTDDPELHEILHLLYRAKVGALGIPFANPRHQHEWRQLKQQPPPDDMVIIPGVIDSTTNYVEHAEVVADRICHVADAIGDPARVIAGVDCGFETWAGQVMVAEDVVWTKLAALADGAHVASRRLWGRK